MKRLHLFAILASVTEAWRFDVGNVNTNITFISHQRRGCTFVDGDEIMGRTYSHYNWDPDTIWNSQTYGTETLSCCAHVYLGRFCQEDRKAAIVCDKVHRAEIPMKWGNLYGSFDVTCHMPGKVPKWDQPEPNLKAPNGPPTELLKMWMGFKVGIPMDVAAKMPTALDPPVVPKAEPAKPKISDFDLLPTSYDSSNAPQPAPTATPLDPQVTPKVQPPRPKQTIDELHWPPYSPSNAPQSAPVPTHRDPQAVPRVQQEKPRPTIDELRLPPYDPYAPIPRLPPRPTSSRPPSAKPSLISPNNDDDD
jgi:hypothetical protein